MLFIFIYSASLYNYIRIIIPSSFEKISQRALFLKLIERNAPLCYVNLAKRF